LSKLQLDKVGEFLRYSVYKLKLIQLGYMKSGSIDMDESKNPLLNYTPRS